MPSKYTKSARDKECQIRIPFVCNRDHSTVVLAHLPNRSIGSKSPDILGAYACSDCHDAVDGRTAPSWLKKPHVRLMFHEGVERTIRIMINDGVLKL